MESKFCFLIHLFRNVTGYNFLLAKFKMCQLYIMGVGNPLERYYMLQWVFRKTIMASNEVYHLQKGNIT